MPKNTQLTALAVNTEANAFAQLMDGGWIEICDGEQPKSGGNSAKAYRVGVTLRLGSPAFTAAIDGTIKANVIEPGIAQLDINPATWARVYMADRKTAVMDVSVGKSDANLILPTTNIAAGVVVTCSSFTHTVARFTPGS